MRVSNWRSRAVLIALALLLAAAAGYAIGSGTADDSCGAAEVKVDGECEAVQRGTPADPPSRHEADAQGRETPLSRAESVAFVLIDEDPAADTLSGRCAFQGIAAQRVDVFLCLMRYHDAPITIRIEHDRGTLVYRWTILGDPQPRDPIYAEKLGSHGTCTYEGHPPCLD